MKYFYLIIILFVLLFNCTFIQELTPIFDNYKYDMEFIDTGNIEENCYNVYEWVHTNITWESNNDNPDIDHIMLTKQGDCKDMVFLMVDILYQYFGYRASYISYNNHALCYYHGFVYDVTNFIIYPIEEYNYQYEIFSFDEINFYWESFRE